MGVVGAMKWRVTAELSNFLGEMAHKEAPLYSNCHKTYVSKSMAYIIDQSDGDFQQGGCLHKPTSDMQWTPKHSWCLIGLRNMQASAKADPSTFGSVVQVIS